MRLLLGVLFIWNLNSIKAQQMEEKSFFIKEIFETALTKKMSYQWLYHLSEQIGGRIAGSPQSLAAINYTHKVLDTLGTHSVIDQACDVNYWNRGAKEEGNIIYPVKKSLSILALGGSTSTPKKGLTGELIELHSIEEIKANAKLIKGKIVFLNRHWNNKNLRTFHSYGEAVDQRVYGPNEASKYGAIACIVRSMTGSNDNVPHAGVTIFKEDVKAIPAVAIGIVDADYLSNMLKVSSVRVKLNTFCKNQGIVQSYSVIGEIKGSEKPNEIILVGGHLDSWDVGGGAHDDGAGCVQSMEVFYLFKQLGYKPRRTLRCVLFMNEENGLAGGLKYAKISKESGEFHYAAIESDAGGFTPKAFSYDIDTGSLKKYTPYFELWSDLFYPYDIKITKGGSGADIGPLKEQKGILFGLNPDSQRYFDYHHSVKDRIEAVHPRELALGSAAMASLVYLLDQTP
ncbi:MAG: M28 family peptidase [Saprospiraceae bacterium]|nr:M28 family peptidase [Saprospiraceae bacterium]